MDDAKKIERFKQLLRKVMGGEASNSEMDEWFSLAGYVKSKYPNGIPNMKNGGEAGDGFDEGSEFADGGVVVADISGKEKQIAEGAYNYFLKHAPVKIGYLKVSVGKRFAHEGEGYELTFYVGAGWGFTYNSKAYEDWFAHLTKRIKHKYPQITKVGMAGYGESGASSQVFVDKNILGKQMNKKEYLKDKGLMARGGGFENMQELELTIAQGKSRDIPKVKKFRDKYLYGVYLTKTLAEARVAVFGEGYTKNTFTPFDYLILKIKYIDDHAKEVEKDLPKYAVYSAEVKDNMANGGAVSCGCGCITGKLDNGGEISCEALEEYLGAKPDYPECKVGKHTFRKAYLRNYYKLK